jgi:hypothetical protein
MLVALIYFGSNQTMPVHVVVEPTTGKGRVNRVSGVYKYSVSASANWGQINGIYLFTPYFWLFLVIFGYFCYYIFAKAFTIIGYYCACPKTIIIGINRKLLLQVTFWLPIICIIDIKCIIAIISFYIYYCN